MKSKLFAVLAMTSVVLVGSLMAEEAAKVVDFSKIKCLISGKPVNAEATADYKDSKVYFCCPGCPGAFTKDTSKFAAKANHQLVATKQAKQVGCPMSGGDLDPDTTIQVAGVDVSFCCGKCQAAANKPKGDDQINLVFSEKAFKKGFEIAKE